MVQQQDNPFIAAVIPQRVLIFGPPGGGKTYLGTRLSEQLGHELFHIDDIVWENSGGIYSKSADLSQIHDQICQIANRQSWIIEGATYPSMGDCMEAADLIVILKPNVWLCHWRIIRRYACVRSLREMWRSIRRGRLRNGMLRFFLSVLWCNHTYERKHQPAIGRMLDEWGKTPIEFKSADEALLDLEGSWLDRDKLANTVAGVE